MNRFAPHYTTFPERSLDPPDDHLGECEDCRGTGYRKDGESCARCETTGIVDAAKEAREERQEMIDRLNEDAIERAAEADENRG